MCYKTGQFYLLSTPFLDTKRLPFRFRLFSPILSIFLKAVSERTRLGE